MSSKEDSKSSKKRKKDKSDLEDKETDLIESDDQSMTEHVDPDDEDMDDAGGEDLDQDSSHWGTSPDKPAYADQAKKPPVEKYLSPTEKFEKLIPVTHFRNDVCSDLEWSWNKDYGGSMGRDCCGYNG